MSTTSLPRIPLGADLGRTQIIINASLDEIDWLLGGFVDSKNVREIGGWLVSLDRLQSKDKDVGMSTEDTDGDDIRFWAGDVITGSPVFYVTKSGLLVAQNANIKGTIEALAGHIGGFTIANDKLYSDSGSGIIQGGTLRSGPSNADRLEFTGGKFAGYTASGNKTGLYFDIGTVAGTGIADLKLYHNDTELLVFFDNIDSYTIRPGSGASNMKIGATGKTLYLLGSVDLGPNTATGKVQYAGHADSADSSSSTESVDWSKVTNHPDPTTTPLMDGSASIGSSGKYAYSDHRHPTDSTRAPLASPAFTGTPTAPTPATADNNTNIATTAYVKNQGYAAVLSGGTKIQSGKSPVTVVANGQVSVTVTFATPFGTAPIVTPVLSDVGFGGSTMTMGVGVSSVTNNSVTFTVKNNSSQTPTLDIYWIAIGN